MVCFNQKKNLNIQFIFYKHQPEEVLILDETINVIVEDQKIIGFTTEEHLMKLNIRNERDLKEVLINAILPTSFQAQTKNLLVNYCDVFAYNYKDLKGIPKEICQHKIELVADAQPIKQRQYRINLNYALKVKRFG
jgi:hypothetical protein